MPIRPARVPASIDRAQPSATLVVAGAHLRGEPLNPALLALGARFLRAARTAPVYRMVALAPVAAPPIPARPGLIRDPGAGRAVEVELYELPVCGLGRLLLTIAPPLAIGAVALDDGTEAPGFVCEGYVRDTAPDISGYGGWRHYRSSLAADPD